jgi:AcrR family transcriptional regulator
MTVVGPSPTTEVQPPRPLLAGPLSARKEQILDSLEVIVLRDGFRSLRITDVAAQLNASYATLYSIAPTKEELVLLVVDRWYAKAIRQASTLLAAQRGPVAQLELWVGAGISGTTMTSAQFWADVSSHASLTQVVEAYSHYYVEVLEAILREGVAAEVVRPINTHALAVYWEAAAAGLRDETYMRRMQGMPVGEIAALWVDLVLHGILKD